MNEVVDEAVALAGVYQLLARLWLREVDEQLLADLSRPPLRDVFTAAGGTLPKHVDTATLEELAVDFCQLFIGPANHLPPYQSVWQAGQFQSSPTEPMRRYTDWLGYDADGVMLDHLGVQCDVMSRLLGSAPLAMKATGELLRLAGTYFDLHLAWAFPLLESAVQRAETDFYQSTIRLTRDFLTSERAFWNAVST